MQFCLQNGVGEEQHPRDPVFYTLVTTDEYKYESYVSVLMCWVPTQAYQRQSSHRNALNLSPTVNSPPTALDVNQINGTAITADIAECSPSNLEELRVAIQRHDNQLSQNGGSSSSSTGLFISISASDLSADSLQTTVYLPQCFVISSRLPCFSLFRDMLRELYTEFIEEREGAEGPSCFSAALNRYYQTSALNPSRNIPGLLFSNMPRLFTYFDHIFKNVPVPPSGKIAVSFSSPSLANQLVLRLPAIDELPLIEVPLRPLLTCLDENNVLRVLALALLERNIVFISKRLSLLTSCPMAIRALMYPLQ